VPQAIQIGPLSLPSGLLLLAFTLIVALLLSNWRKPDGGADGEGHIYRILIAGAVSARLGFVLQNHQAYLDAPWSILDIRDGGWLAWAGFFGALIYASALLHRRPSLKKLLLQPLLISSSVWVVGMVLLSVPPREAQHLPDFSTLSMEGQQTSLPSYAGKPTVINLWATWCPPCRREMPAFQRVQNEHQDVNIVFLNQGEAPTEIQQFLVSNKLYLQNVLLDTQSEVGRSLGHRSLPTTLFFSADGRLVSVRVGEFSYATLTQRIKALKAGQRALVAN